jgi:hypothetical protein
MYVQRDIVAKPENAESGIDIIVEDCVRQYRSTGMTFADAGARMQTIAARLEEAAHNAAEEKREYYDAHEQ